MPEENTDRAAEPSTDERGELAHKLGAIGWALFFIWVGIALLLKVDASVGLLGVGILTLGMQLARKYFNQRPEGFWIVVGLLFVVGGLWGLFEARLPLVPILLVIAGIVVLVSALRGKRATR